MAKKLRFLFKISIFTYEFLIKFFKKLLNILLYTNLILFCFRLCKNNIFKISCKNESFKYDLRLLQSLTNFYNVVSSKFLRFKLRTRGKLFNFL